MRKAILPIFFAFVLFACGNDSSVTPTPPKPKPPVNKVCLGTTFPSGGIGCKPSLKDDELEVVTWNIERFPKGANTITEVAKIIKDLNADIYAIQEITDIAAFNNLGKAIDGYTALPVDVNGSLELGFIYKTADITSVSSAKMLFEDQTSPFPREAVEIDIKHKNGLSVKLINLHLKCCGGDRNKRRRTDASEILKEYIDKNAADKAVIVLGDWNEEIRKDSSFDNFKNDSTNYIFTTKKIANGDNANWSFPRWPSQIDQILITDELCDNITSSYTIKLDGCITKYADNVSDHRPVMATFKAD